jgi:hypothetical protein
VGLLGHNARLGNRPTPSTGVRKGSSCDDERTDLARLNQPPKASAAGSAYGMGGRSTKYEHSCVRLPDRRAHRARSATTASRASAADTCAARMAAAAWGPMVIEVNGNPDLNAIASLMPAAGVYEHLNGAIIGA